MLDKWDNNIQSNIVDGYWIGSERSNKPRNKEGKELECISALINTKCSINECEVVSMDDKHDISTWEGEGGAVLPERKLTKGEWMIATALKLEINGLDLPMICRPPTPKSKEENAALQAASDIGFLSGASGNPFLKAIIDKQSNRS